LLVDDRIRIRIQEAQKHTDPEQWNNVKYLAVQVNESLLELHRVASDKGDGQFCDFLESHFLKEQVESIKKVKRKGRKSSKCMKYYQCQHLEYDV
jgi:ferritin